MTCQNFIVSWVVSTQSGPLKLTVKNTASFAEAKKGLSVKFRVVDYSEIKSGPYSNSMSHEFPTVKTDVVSLAGELVLFFLALVAWGGGAEGRAPQIQF